MFLIRIIPLAKLPSKVPAILDYFWLQSLSRGAIVRAPMGRRIVPALVVDVQDFRIAKLAVKKSSFSLKKLESIITNIPQLTVSQMALAQWISVQYACSPATALKSVAPAFIGKRGNFNDHGTRVIPTLQQPGAAVFLTQPSTALETITDTFAASKGQTLVLVPDRLVAQSLASKLSGVRVVHGGLSAHEMKSVYRGVLDGSLRQIVGTWSALFLPWSALTHIVVEDPLNEMYKSDMTPRINAPDVARHLAALHGAKLTWLTASLSTVQFHLARTGKLAVRHRKPHWPLVDVTTVESERTAGNRGVFSRSAQAAFMNAFDQHASVLIYSARRGYATAAICLHCHSTVSCPTCSIPMRWNRSSEDMLVCYHCASFTAVPRVCAVCRVGTIRPAGTPGSQKLAESVNIMLDRHGYPKIDIPLLDSDLIRSPADVRRTFEHLDRMTNPILIATGMIHSHRYDRRFHTIIVPHLDMLASNPDYRAHDRLILQLEKLADLAPERMILQSFHNDGIVPLIPSREWDTYFEEELSQRKNFRWPPYARIVKLSFTHRDRGVTTRSADTAVETLRRAAQHIGVSGLHILGPTAALVENAGGRWTQFIIIKSTLTAYRLSELLQYTPDGWVVDIDPRNIA